MDKGDIYLAAAGAIVTAILGGIGVLSTQAIFSSILLILGIISLSLFRARWAFEEIKAIIPEKSAIEIYEREEDAEEALVEYVNERIKKGHPIKKATLVQYSISLKIAKKLLESNVDLVLYIQDEATTRELGSNQQYHYILQSIDQLRFNMTRPPEQYQIEIHKYKVPGSVAFIVLDNDVLCASWYSYIATDQTNRWKLGAGYEDDRFLVLGLDKAAIVIRKEHPGFHKLIKTFNDVVENFKINSSQTYLHPPSGTPIGDGG